MSAFIGHESDSNEAFYVSVISLGVTREGIAAVDERARDVWQKRFDIMRRTLYNRKSIVSLDLSSAEEWASLRNLPFRKRNRQPDALELEWELMVCATAIAKGYTLVDYEDLYHNELVINRGLRFVDPGGSG